MQAATDRRSWSLQRRLLAIAAFACSATLLAGGFAMYQAADREDQRMLDERLAALSQTILRFSEHEIREILEDGRDTEPVHQETAATLGSRYLYQIWTGDGRLLLRSYKAPASTPMAPLAQRGFGDAQFDSETFRTFAQEGRDGMVIQVAECLDERESAVGIVSIYFLSFLLVPFLLIIGITHWLLKRSLRAIDSSAQQLGTRSPLDLTPVQADNPPQELRPMLGAINGLFGRIEAALSIERGFTAVAAHEMRTPLAGLRAQAQLATRTTDPAELQECLRSLMLGVDRASHLLDQLLDLARSDSLVTQARLLQGQTVDVNEVYQNVMSDLGPSAAQRELAMKAHFNATEAPALELGLHLLLHNLVGNAIRYTPPGGSVEISTSRADGAFTLTVDDSGPGIPPGQEAQAFERFNRLGQMDPNGVGLGLSIVHSVVQAHRAAIRLLRSPLGGLRVEVQFQPTAAAG